MNIAQEALHLFHIARSAEINLCCGGGVNRAMAEGRREGDRHLCLIVNCHPPSLSPPLYVAHKYSAASSRFGRRGTGKASQSVPFIYETPNSILWPDEMPNPDTHPSLAWSFVRVCLNSCHLQPFHIVVSA